MLWIAADGKCQICGCELQADWHADHVVPWSVKQETNVHDMQATCPQCNLEKGCKMFQLRKHQREFDSVMHNIAAGAISPKKVLCLVTPGGGKSLLALIAAKHLLRGYADKICVVVPRINLGRQTEAAFCELRGEFGVSREIRYATNDIDPSRGHLGYITTYNAMVADPRLHADEFRRSRYVLLLDEPHHVGDEQEWIKKIGPLAAMAKLVVLMTGTLEKGDGSKIAFIDYREDGTPILEDTPDQKVIRYSRTDALLDGAIVPIDFYHADANAEWVDLDGNRKQREGFEGATWGESRAMLRTVLATDGSDELLAGACQDWMAFRRDNPWSQFLIVAEDIAAARRASKVASGIIGERISVATCKETEDAHRNIAKFCRNEISALSTVWMAYEGMDAKGVTHIAFLSGIRSKPFVEQCVGRAVRAFPKHGKTHGVVYVFDDRAMLEIIKSIKDEQIAAARIRDEQEQEKTNQPERDQSGAESGGIIPQASQVVGLRASSLECESQLGIGQIQYLRENGLNGLSVQALTKFTQDVLTNGGIPGTAVANRTMPASTPREREDRLRAEIDKLTKKADRHHFNGEFGSANGELIRAFNKPRGEMTEAELQGVRQYIARRWTL